MAFALLWDAKKGSRKVIYVSTLACEVLSQSELRFLLAHEIGHSRQRRLSKAPNREKRLRREKWADAFAAKHTRATSAVSTLEKLYEYAVMPRDKEDTQKRITAIRKRFKQK